MKRKGMNARWNKRGHMKSVSKFICLILLTNLIVCFTGISFLTAGVSIPSKAAALKESGQDKKMEAGKKSKAEEAYGKLPLCFESNHGQTDASVKFLARGKGYTLFLTSTEAVLALKTAAGSKAEGLDVVRMKLKDANIDPVFQGMDLLSSQSSYMTGNDPKKWQTKIEQYSKVEIKQIYPGINMVYYGNNGQLEYDFVVAPGANPGLIKMIFKGAKNLELDQKGNLVLNLQEGRLAFNAPTLYQKTGSKRDIVAGRFVLSGNEQVSFEVAAYDKKKELVIDPTLAYSTYLGTTVADRVNSMYVDTLGNVYLTGETAGTGFPGTAGHYQNFNKGGAYDAFVLKINPAGAVEWGTYLGGGGVDVGRSITVSGTGIIYICGATTSAGAAFPTTVIPSAASYQAVNNGGTDAFLTAIAASGNSLVYSMFIGGAGEEFAFGVAVDSTNNAYVTGGTTSNNTTLPVTGGFQGDNAAGVGDTHENAFVAKFNSAGTVQFFTYLGGTTIGGGGTGEAFDPSLGGTHGNAIALDSSNNIYVTGKTVAGFPIYPLGTEFPYVGIAYKTTISGAPDAFVSKISTNGATLLYSTYLGGSGMAMGFAIKVDSVGNVYVAGDNDSDNFPEVTIDMPKVGQTTIAGGPFDCFIMKMKLDAAGSLDGVYCTFLGGKAWDHVNALAVDSFGNAYVTGRTASDDFVSISPASINTPLDSVYGAVAKAFVTVIGPDGSTRILNSYIGGVSDQEGRGIGLDAENNIYVSGWTTSTDFPTAIPFYEANKGTYDGFVMKISATSPATLAAPAITGINPNVGPIAGNTTVTITGSGFSNVAFATGVKFGSVNAASYVVISDTKITAKTPAHAAGIVDVVTTNTVGSSPAVTADRFTFFVTPAISSSGDFEPFIFPSPVTGSTAGIAYYMTGSGTVKIKIYNEVGNMVSSLEEIKSLGSQGSTLNVSNLAPGIYFHIVSMTYDDGGIKKYSKRKFAVTR
ncbi:MAG: hypothetical protein A2452_12085 [Candidatus Firestonebacteria bacterium RIFOXYC2_FULL_39_67]|nr:MAG: hypothetical protein A2536_00250 [Candidatus Firestonebacteria bacterium RIFOXYD2_FULL_39_29]OGF55706.1 MAG: hypothetical protein A2452_12085 [Candidatus Firestonebacteria bacterium RIFOXYC2_FULL_39_67]